MTHGPADHSNIVQVHNELLCAFVLPPRHRLCVRFLYEKKISPISNPPLRKYE